MPRGPGSHLLAQSSSGTVTCPVGGSCGLRAAVYRSKQIPHAGPTIMISIRACAHIFQGTMRQGRRHVPASRAAGGPLNTGGTCWQVGCRSGPTQHRPAAHLQWLATVRSGSTTLGKQLRRAGSYRATAAQCQRYGPLARHRCSAQRHNSTASHC
jgi:hypothetical protein